MSEHEPQPTQASSKSWIMMVMLGALVGGGCLLTCVGAIGFGFYMPMLQQRRAVEAEMKATLQQEELARQLQEATREQAEAAQAQAEQLHTEPTATEQQPAADQPQETVPDQSASETEPK